MIQPFLHLTKPIRELRMGPPKCWKTGGVLETYPLPLLCFQFDQDGSDVVTKRRVLKIKPDELKSLLSKTSDDILKLADIIEIPFYSLCRPQVTDDWTSQKNMETFKRIMWAI